MKSSQVLSNVSVWAPEASSVNITLEYWPTIGWQMPFVMSQIMLVGPPLKIRKIMYTQEEGGEGFTPVVGFKKEWPSVCILVVKPCSCVCPGEGVVPEQAD